MDVTDKIIERVKSSSCSDRLSFKPVNKLNEVLALTEEDKRKINKNNGNLQLRVRYRIGLMHGTLVLDFMSNHTIPAPFLLILPRTRYLRIYSGTYGYPKGEYY